MQRRGFLKVAGAAGLMSTLGGFPLVLKAQADETPEATDPALEVRRVESDRFVLEFHPTEPRPLRILQLTDTHFGSVGYQAKENDARSFEELRRLVAQEKIDFVVHTGDFINNDQGLKVSLEAIEFMDSLGIPWTHALGNHDHGMRTTKELRAPMKNASVGEFRSGNRDEYAFRFDLVTPASDAPTWSIYCFDSGFREPNRKVSPAQLEWFAAQMKRDADEGITAPALAMIHIPVIEFEKLRAAELQQGNYGERVCFDSDRGDTFATLDKNDRVRAVFSGHDHENDYSGKWEGVELVYGRVSGWSGYGDLPRGGRLIEVDPAKQTYSHRIVLPA
ncbi:MAG: metallophosphoesterase [Pirellulales bacterium]|nr:metallophosphoesterase [Pirellulales bacterium]